MICCSKPSAASPRGKARAGVMVRTTVEEAVFIRG